MSFELKNNGAYNRREHVIFDAIRNHGRISTLDLVDVVYATQRRRPLNARVAVRGSVRGLQQKIERNKEPFRLRNDKHKGPYAQEFWLEAK